MTAVCFPLFFGSTSLYVYLVTVACCQLEKLKVAILNIKQKHNLGAKDDKEMQDDGQERMLHETRQQLNDCILHHQQILGYGSY
jgi:hypothetical protein